MKRRRRQFDSRKRSTNQPIKADAKALLAEFRTLRSESGKVADSNLSDHQRQPITPASAVAARPVRTIESVLNAALQPKSGNSVDSKRSERSERSKRYSYFRDSCRPLSCLVFVLPMILLYEAVTLLKGSDAIRSGMDLWLVHCLSYFGLGQLAILPMLTAGIMIVAHHRKNDRWEVNPSTFLGMLVESLGLGAILYFAAKSIVLFSQPHFSEMSQAISSRWWAETVAVVGSGIYEELIFRLILLTALLEYFRRAWPRQSLQWLGIGLVSLLFAALHYNFINPSGANFELTTFLFRFAASIIFSTLFLHRGFGIAVGAHVAFDVLVQCLG